MARFALKKKTPLSFKGVGFSQVTHSSLLPKSPVRSGLWLLLRVVGSQVGDRLGGQWLSGQIPQGKHLSTGKALVWFRLGTPKWKEGDGEWLRDSLKYLKLSPLNT